MLKQQGLTLEVLATPSQIVLAAFYYLLSYSSCHLRDMAPDLSSCTTYQDKKLS